MISKIEKLISKQLIELLPNNVAFIDRNLNIVHANKNFTNYFGEWKGKKCYEVYKKCDFQCKGCRISEVFNSGSTIISNESGVNNKGRLCHYIVQVSPLKDDDGKVLYTVEMSTDITKTDQIQREYDLLFDSVPSYVSIIDKHYRIIKGNKKLIDTFGEVHGKHCYEVYKKRKKRCKHCPASMTFKDKQEHISSEIGITSSGEETQYLVNATPLSYSEGNVNLVIEIATDITELSELQNRLRKTHDYYVSLIENASLGIIALDENNKVVIFNPLAKKIFYWNSFRKPVLNQLKKILPAQFFDDTGKEAEIANAQESFITTLSGEVVPVRFSAIRLFSKNKLIGKVAFLRDIRQLKELEKQMFDAERLSAVGQTVAGLAHTIKNLLMGLEGGMYIVDSGLRKADAVRIVEGWEILQRNFTKTTDLVKGFLSFAKGRQPKLKLINPNSLINNLIELYEHTAKNQNVSLESCFKDDIPDVYLDPEGMEACLTNLLSNAIDAAMMRDDKNGHVLIKTDLSGDQIIFEIIDNGCGIDSDVIQNIFTTFFTTKGNKGTGLGLLTTNKIVKEHGGYMNVVSDPGKGSTFSMTFSIERLNSIYFNSQNNGIQYRNEF
ncbi:MAG: Histidine kinase protein [Ignavibacteria bacterium]|nr:Histidine kinase protein [Ignavibacteria bacterium]